MSAIDRIDLTPVVERAARTTWDERNGETFGSWEVQAPGTKAHVRESMLPTVVAVRDAFREPLEAMLDQARAEALREAAEQDAITIPDVLGYKVPAVAVEDLLNRADRIGGAS